MDGSNFSHMLESKEHHAEEMIKFGKELIILKSKVGHGNWKNYMKKHFKCSVRTCQHAMDLARQNISTDDYSLGTEKLKTKKETESKTKMEKGKMKPIIIKSDDVTKAIIDEIRTSPNNQLTLVGLLEEVSQTEKKVSKSKIYRVVTELIEKGVIQRTNQKATRRVIFEKVPDAIDALILQHGGFTRDKIIRAINKFSSKSKERFNFLQIYLELQKEDPNISQSTVRNYFHHIRIGGMIKEDGKLAGFPKVKLYRLVTPQPSTATPVEKEEVKKAEQTITRDEVFDIMVERLRELKKLKQEHNESIALINSLRKNLTYVKEQNKDEIKATDSWKQCFKELEKETIELRKTKERNEDLGKLIKEKSETEERIRSLISENFNLKKRLSKPDVRIEAIKTAHKEETNKLHETIKKLKKYYSQKERELYQLKAELKELQKEKTIHL